MNEIVRLQKMYAIEKASMGEENLIEGIASATGVMDRTRDVIFPGAYSKAITDFLKDGFVSLGHDWTSYIAMPIEAREEGRHLYTKARFHSTDDAQQVRTKVKERLDNNLSVGLSVGFSMGPDDRKWFENGTDLLTYARGLGYDTQGWDEAGIMGCEGYCRGIFSVRELYEYAITPVPANKGAKATTVKDFREADLASLPFEEFSEEVLMILQGYAEKAAGYRAHREGKSQSLSTSRRTEFQAIKELLEKVLLEDSEQQSEEEPKSSKSYLELSTRTLGLTQKIRRTEC